MTTKGGKSKPPATLKALYAEITGDTATHQRTIDSRFHKLPSRHQATIRARLAGESYHQIAIVEGLTAATVRDALLRAIERIRKGVHEEPRYNRVGRKHGRQD